MSIPPVILLLNVVIAFPKSLIMSSSSRLRKEKLSFLPRGPCFKIPDRS